MKVLKKFIVYFFFCYGAIIVAYKFGAIDEIASWTGEKIAYTNASQILAKYLVSPSSYIEKESELIWSGTDSDGDNAYIVRLDYESKNVYGTLIPGCSYVSYTSDEEKIYWSETIGVVNCPRSGEIIKDQVVGMIKTASFGLEHPEDMSPFVAEFALADLTD